MPRDLERVLTAARPHGRDAHAREIVTELRQRDNGQMRVAYQVPGVDVSWPAPGPPPEIVRAFFDAHVPTELAERREAAEVLRVATGAAVFDAAQMAEIDARIQAVMQTLARGPR